MSDWRDTICKAFIDRLPDEEQVRAMNKLSPQMRHRLLQLPTTLTDPFLDFEPFEEKVRNLHPTRLAHSVKELAPIEMRIFLGLLPQDVHSRIRNELNLSITPIKVSKMGGNYFKVRFTDFFFKDLDALLPIELLPDSLLNKLLLLSHDQLETLLFHLGLYDLARNMRTILEAKTLQNILRALNSPKERRAIERLLKAPEPFTLPRGEALATDPTGIRNFCRIKGLTRLGKALADRHHGLLLHICQSMDEASAKQLQLSAKPSQYTDYYFDQVLALCDQLEKEVLT